MHPPACAADITDRIWSELHTACSNKQHAWRSPVLASVDKDGFPRARTVVLRAVDTPAQQLIFFTDQRSPKVQELKACSRAEIVFWSPSLQWQLRAAVVVEVQTQGSKVDQAWARIKNSPAATDYLHQTLPGATQEAESHHLCLLLALVKHLDWLELAPQGHRRLRIQGTQGLPIGDNHA